MAVPAASSIVSYGGGAVTSNFLTTPVTPFLAGFYSSNFVNDRINSCAPFQVERIKKNLRNEEEEGFPASENRRKGALFCRSGTWMEVLPFESEEDGSTQVKVHGTRNENSKFSIVEFISVAMSLVSIRGVETNNFICMDPSGKLYATPSSNYSTECVFVEEMMENYYNMYSSCAYGNRSHNPWYIELRRSGKPRRGPNSKKRRKASHFLVVHHDLDRLRHPNRPNGNDLTDLVVASLFHQPPSHPFYRPQAPTKPPSQHRISNLRAKVEVAMDAAEREKLLAEKKRRREKKKRRREDRLRKEEAKREARREELRKLREEEIRRREEVLDRYHSRVEQERRQPTTADPRRQAQYLTHPSRLLPTGQPYPPSQPIRPAYDPYQTYYDRVTNIPAPPLHHHRRERQQFASSQYHPQQQDHRQYIAQYGQQPSYPPQTVSNPNRQNVNYQRYP